MFYCEAVLTMGGFEGLSEQRVELRAPWTLTPTSSRHFCWRRPRRLVAQDKSRHLPGLAWLHPRKGRVTCSCLGAQRGRFPFCPSS